MMIRGRRKTSDPEWTTMREMLSCKTCWVVYFDKLTYCVSTDCVAHAKLLVTTTTTVEGLPKRNTMHATTSAQVGQLKIRH